MKISIQKPVKSATLLGVIAATPVHHTEIDHTMCVIRSQFSFSGLGSRRLMASSCAAETGKPLLRAMQRIHRIRLGEGACLLPEPGALTWSTHVRLADTTFAPEINEAAMSAVCFTVFELLRLAGRHAGPTRFRDLDGEETDDFYHFRLCQRRPVYSKYQIELSVNSEGIGAFIRKVSCRNLRDTTRTP